MHPNGVATPSQWRAEGVANQLPLPENRPEGGSDRSCTPAQDRPAIGAAVKVVDHSIGPEDAVIQPVQLSAGAQYS
jgi:hypothetical protein